MSVQIRRSPKPLLRPGTATWQWAIWEDPVGGKFLAVEKQVTRQVKIGFPQRVEKIVRESYGRSW